VDHIFRSMERAIQNNGFSDLITLKNVDDEILCDFHADNVSVDTLRNILSTLSSVRASYENKPHASRPEKINKYAMHLVRLQEMGIEILNGEGLHTKRKEDHDLLMSLRNGDFRNDMSSYWKLVEDLEEELRNAAAHSSLPDTCDREAVNSLVVEMISDFLKL